MTFRSDGELHDSGEVLEYEPYRRLSYTWRVEFHEVFRHERPSRVTFELEPVGAEVKLTVFHDEFEPGSKVLGAVSNGWPVVLSSLKSLLETGHAFGGDRRRAGARGARAGGGVGRARRRLRRGQRHARAEISAEDGLRHLHREHA